MSCLEDFSHYARIIPTEHLDALQQDLRKVPDFSWLLDRPHSSIERLQGDMIKNFPVVFLDETASPSCQKFTAMILNNTCDLPDDRLDFVTAAPVVDFKKYLEFEREKRIREKGRPHKERKRQVEESLQGYADAIRRNNKTELLYLPRFGDFPDGALVLLHLVASVSSRIYHEALRNGCRVASFTQTGFYFLLIKLTTHLSRAESAEVVRTGTAASAS